MPDDAAPEGSALWQAQDGRPLYQPDHTSVLDFELPAMPSKERWRLLPRVDAVVVPASRPAEELKHVASLARAAAKTLIVLCSHECRPEEVRAQLENELDAWVPVVVVDMNNYSWRKSARGLQLHKDLRWEMNTALKRNVGLLIARRLGLRHVLFVDDDVFGLKGEWVRHAGSLVASGKYRAAAWTFNDFPDNSAVSHAYRRFSGEPLGRQRCFVGGGGMLVGLDDHVPHFPLGIYNEDWLFLIDLLSRGEVAMMGELCQKPYAPFVNRKASAQEFGDLIAEHAMSVLAAHRDMPTSRLYELLGSKDYWSGPLGERRRFLSLLSAAIDDRKAERKSEKAQLQAAAEAVSAASAASRLIRKHHVRAWVNALRHDCLFWREQWARTGQRPRERHGLWVRASFLSEIKPALKDLELSDHAEVIWCGPNAFRHRIPEPIRARVPAKFKLALARTVRTKSAKRMKGVKPVVGDDSLVASR